MQRYCFFPWLVNFFEKKNNNFTSCPLYLRTSDSHDLLFPKICFCRRPHIQVDYDRFSEHKRNLYNVDWQYINGTSKFPTDKNHIIEKPKVLNEMLSLAKRLSSGIPQLRVDFYVVNDKVYFGELTLYHGSGFEKYNPKQLGKTLGDYIVLPKGKQNV